MEKYITSDLIMESSFIDKIRSHIGQNKKCYNEEIYGDFSVCRITLDEDKYERKKGTYITIYTPKLYLLDSSEQRKLSSLLSCEISRVLNGVLPNGLTRKSTILVAGIGNREITPDAIGPFTSEKIEATRHIMKLDSSVFERMSSCCVSSIACGVMGDTGMDTAEILSGIVSNISPDAIIAVDALAAKECSSLGAAIQISDSGIVPGAGVGNRQSEISRETLGVPVIAIGVPTVVSAATLVSDMLIKKGVRADEGDLGILNHGKNFFVAPKECDLLCMSASAVMADAINNSLTVI